MKLYVDGKALLLGENPRIRLTWVSPLFADEQPGSYTNQFSVPVCDQNAQILGWTHIPASAAERRKDYPAELTVGAFRLVGTLQCREITRDYYKCNLIVTPANIPAAVWKRKLQQFDFESVTYQEIPFSLLHYNATLPNFSGSSFKTVVKVYDGDRILFDHTYEGITQSSGNGEVLPNKFWQDVADRIISDDNPYWEYWRALGLKEEQYRIYEAAGTDTMLTLSARRSGTFKVIYQVIRYYEGRPYGRPYTVSMTPTSGRLLLQGQSLENLDMRTDERYCMPMMKNVTWYGEDNKTWNGYVNHVLQFRPGVMGGYASNVEQGTRYSLSPAIRLPWLIEKTLAILGYRLNDQVFTDAELKQLALWTNQSLDELIPDTAITWNQWKNNWKIADHLPNLTMKEWVNAFGKNLFFKPIFYPGRKECVLVFLKDVLATTNVISWSSKLVKTWEQRTEDRSPVQSKYVLDSGDDLCKLEDSTTKKPVPLFQSVPTDEVVDAQQDVNFQSLEFPFAPILTDRKVIKGTFVRGQGYVTEDREVSMMPTLKQTGISVLYSQDKTEKNPGRLLFYVPEKLVPDPFAPEDSTLEEFPNIQITTADYETPHYSLQLAGENGTLQKLGKAWLDLLSKPGTEKYRVVLNPIDLQNFRWEYKYHLNGLNYLIDTIDVTFEKDGINEPAEITCRRV